MQASAPSSAYMLGAKLTALVLPLFKEQAHIRVELRRALSIKGNRALPLLAAGRLLHIDLEVDALYRFQLKEEVHHTRKQPAGDSFETISGTTGLLGCADGALLMQKKKRTALETTVDVVGRDQQNQILYLKKDADTQIWSLERTENEPYQEPPDPVLDTVSQLVSSESREWTGSPTELAETVNTGMAANALTKYLNVKSGRLLDEYHVKYENRAKHSGRQVKLTYIVIDNVEYEVIE